MSNKSPANTEPYSSDTSDNRLNTSVVPKDIAMKYDFAKTKVDLYPVRAYLATCQVFTYGAEVYDVGNWHAGDGFKWSRLIASAERHLLDFKGGINYDKDSGLHVLAHMACCVAMLLEHVLTNHGEDDRAKAQLWVADGNVGDTADFLKLLTMDPVVMERAKQIKKERLAKQLEAQAVKK